MSLRRVIIVLAFLVLVATGVALAADRDSSPGPTDVRLVELTGSEEKIWPYTSRHADFTTRTLAINLIVHDDPDVVRYRLERRSNVSWTELNESQETANFSVAVNDNRVGFDWTSAHGAMRYTYVQRGDQGIWLPQRYQLHAGTYLGTRSHVRAYAPDEDSDWTALQAHSEYWDWFRLRHTVTDVWDTRRDLEQDFADQPLVTDVERAHATERGPTSEGISVVHVGWMLLLVSTPPVRRRIDSVATEVRHATPTGRRALALFAFTMGVPLAVRAGGLALEAVFPWLTPKILAAPLYVLLVVGLPVGVYRLSESVPSERAIVIAGVGFLAGITLDAIALDVAVVLTQYGWHRLLLAVGLGGIAAGNHERRRPRALLVVGFALWAIGVLMAAFGMV